MEKIKIEVLDSKKTITSTNELEYNNDEGNSITITIGKGFGKYIYHLSNTGEMIDMYKVNP